MRWFSGEVTCQPFFPVSGCSILSGMSHHKSYTVVDGGSMSSKDFHSAHGLHEGVLIVVQRLRITFSSDCAFCDKSTKIGTHVVLYI